MQIKRMLMIFGNQAATDSMVFLAKTLIGMHRSAEGVKAMVSNVVFWFQRKIHLQLILFLKILLFWKMELPNQVDRSDSFHDAIFDAANQCPLHEDLLGDQEMPHFII